MSMMIQIVTKTNLHSQQAFTDSRTCYILLASEKQHCCCKQHRYANTVVLITIYRTSFMCASRCHSEFGIATRYVRLVTVWLQRMAQPSRSTRWRLCHTRSPCSTNPRARNSQWLNYSARGGGSLQARGLKRRSSSPNDREHRGGVPDRRPGVFEHSRHSVWLLWHLNSVLRLRHLSTPSVDKCKWQNDREGLHFFAKYYAYTEKYSNINCAECWSQQKGAGSQLFGAGSVIRGSGSQIRGAGSAIRRDPPQFNPW